MGFPRSYEVTVPELLDEYVAEANPTPHRGSSPRAYPRGLEGDGATT